MKFKLATLFNAPNKITIIRVALIPLFALVLWADIPYKNIFAAFIFGMLSVSDFFDGYLARKKKQVTELGKLIDPIADKLLISTALISLIGQGVELWMAVVIIAREVILTGVRIYLLPSKIILPASIFGKAKTVVQSIAIVFVLLKLQFSWHMMIAAVLLTLASGIEYMVRIRKMTGNKVVNLPNIITLFRFLLIIPFVYYFLNLKISASLIIFAAITLSDKLDGVSARLMNQKTELGSALDSFTDWTLIIITFILLAAKSYISALWVVLFAVPSITSGVMKMMYAKKQKVVPVTFISRLGVVLTYIALIFMLISFGYRINFDYTFYLLTTTLVIVYLAMFVYVFKALKCLNPVAKKSSKKNMR